VNKIFKQLLIIGLSVSALITLNNCGGANCISNSPTPIIHTPEDILIETGGQIPAPNGANVTTTVYVHNYTSHPINNITYGILNINTPITSNQHLSLNDGNDFIIDHNSQQTCSTINANSSCALIITTPSVIFGNKGSITIYLSANNNIAPQIINWYYYQLGVSQAVNFSLLSNNLNLQNSDGGYFTQYLIADGNPGDIYHDIELQQPLGNTVSITQGIESGLEIAVGEVVPVEIKTNLISNFATAVNLIPSAKLLNGLSKKKYTAESIYYGDAIAFNILPFNAASISLSNPSILAGESRSQVVTIINNGTKSGIVSVSLEGNFAVTNGNCNGKFLESHTNCSFTYSVTDTASNQYGRVVATLESTIQTSALVYVKTLSDPIITISQSSNVIALAPVESQAMRYVIYNIGQQALSGFNTTSTPSGNTNFTQTSSSCGNSLSAESLCIINGYIRASSNPETATITQTILQNSTLITQAIALVYVVNNPVITFSNSGSLTLNTIRGNGTDTSTGTFIISNSSQNSLATVIDSESFATPDGLSVANSSCIPGTTLAFGESCSVTFQAGPTLLESTNIAATVPYAIYYHGLNQSGIYSSNASVSYQILAQDTSLNIESIISSTQFSGSGQSSDPYIFYTAESSIATPYIKITYKNQSNNYSLSHFTLQTSSLSPIWQPDASSTCGYGVNKQILAPLATCYLQLNLNRTYIYNFDTLDSGVTDLNFNFPNASWQESGEVAQPRVVTQDNMSYNNSTTLFVKSLNAVLNSTFNVTGGNLANIPHSNSSLTITQTMTNAPSYSLPIQISSLNTFANPIITPSSACSTDSGNSGIVICNYSATTPSGSITYDFDASAVFSIELTTAVTFTLESSATPIAIGFNPYYQNLTMPANH
jgi:hypothetical protein